MDIHRKHLDDFEEFNEFDEQIDTNIPEEEAQDVAPNPQFLWRRALIARAAEKVKRVLESSIDTQIQYKKAELVFDNQRGKFARINESSKGFLSLSTLDGEEIIHRAENPENYIKDNRQKSTVVEMAKYLHLEKSEVVSLLNKLEADETNSKISTKKPQKIIIATSKAPALKTKNLKLSVNLSKKLKPDSKKKSSVNNNSDKKTSGKIRSSISFTKFLPKGATTDPIMDPNGYIQQNYLLLDNRELSTATGLSVHTIRRKLGEWGLKRKVNLK